MAGILGWRIIIDSDRSAERLAAIGAAAKHHIRKIAGIIAHRTEDIDIAARRARGAIDRNLRLTNEAHRIDIWKSEHQWSAKIEDGRKIKRGVCEAVMIVG